MEYTSVLLVVVVGAVLYVIYLFNRFVTLKNRCRESYSDIDVQLKRRYDLIPNLVQTVQGYAKHEKAVFEQVTKLRSSAMQQNTKHDQAVTENMISQTLKSIFAVAENYPELKANENFLELQKELTDIEDKIQAARRFYNSNVMAYNTALQVFPNSLFASMFDHRDMEFFEVDQSNERENVQIDL